jgi:hypothetical protein
MPFNMLYKALIINIIVHNEPSINFSTFLIAHLPVPPSQAAKAAKASKAALAALAAGDSCVSDQCKNSGTS